MGNSILALAMALSLLVSAFPLQAAAVPVGNSTTSPSFTVGPPGTANCPAGQFKDQFNHCLTPDEVASAASAPAPAVDAVAPSNSTAAPVVEAPAAPAPASGTESTSDTSAAPEAAAPEAAPAAAAGTTESTETESTA
ncbi:MAG: hypothetical protein M1838_002487 [Thelocarpon superellum]|nr:MAG: hypothetical protein M1838_002487 [Thelocarpon superellum]